jgi:hypothetical protein
MPVTDKLTMALDATGIVVVSGAWLGAAIFFMRCLSSGVATIHSELEFRRDEEPREFWAIALIPLAGVTALPWLISLMPI